GAGQAGGRAGDGGWAGQRKQLHARGAPEHLGPRRGAAGAGPERPAADGERHDAAGDAGAGGSAGAGVGGRADPARVAEHAGHERNHDPGSAHRAAPRSWDAADTGAAPRHGPAAPPAGAGAGAERRRGLQGGLEDPDHFLVLRNAVRIRKGNGAFRAHPLEGTARALLPALLIMLAVPGAARAQRVLTEAERVISVAKGRSALYQHPGAIGRISVGDPNVVDVQLVSEREIVINARELGTTSLFVWDRVGGLHLFAIEVTADAPGLERYLRGLFPGEQIVVTASGNTVTLSGQVSSAVIAQRALE